MKLVKLENVTYNGTYARNAVQSNKNCGVILKADDQVIIKNVTFTQASCPGDNEGVSAAAQRYNGIEIGLNNGTRVYRPKKIDIENVRFEGQISNNAILIFDCADNAVINIKNCYFNKVSNAIRFSNYSMSKNVTINIEDCVINQWESRPAYDGWQGFMLLEDYRGDHNSVLDLAKCFGKETGLVINIKNLTLPDGILYTQEDVEGSLGLIEDRTKIVINACVDHADGNPHTVSEFGGLSAFPTINVSPLKKEVVGPVTEGE